MLQGRPQIWHLICGVLFSLQQSIEVSVVSVARQPGRGENLSQNRRGSIYLKTDRPLWILDDRVVRHGELSRHFFTTSMPFHLADHQRRQRKPKYTNNRINKQPQRIQLPNHYMQPIKQNLSYAARKSYAWLKEVFLQHQPRTANRKWAMPYFDSLPGDDNADPLPIFIYNGPKGELLLNTMLYTQKYPMQEPVPGQLLFPPIAPIFRPKSIVQRFRVDIPMKKMNLTLIPFYAHEAIEPRSLDFESDSTVWTTTTAPASVLYATPKATTIGKPSKKKRSKWQDYKAYRSQQDVQWLPETTTAFPLAMASPLRNHRNNELDEVTTILPVNDHYMKDADENFKIVYMDDSKEKPTSAALHSSRYSVPQEIYEFPVFTLGKLLKPERQQSGEVTAHKDPKNVQDDEASETWFILNSRYKGHSKHNDKYRLSSKYIQKTASVTAPTSTSNYVASEHRITTNTITDKDHV